MKGKFLITCFFLVMLLWSLPAEAADPAECSPGLIPSNAPNTTGIGCAKDTDYTYDLSINQWNTTTHISPDILVGYEWSSPPTDDKPRFFVYKDGSNFRFYTWLYARFTNDSGSIACPDSPAAGPVKVVYSYTESSDPADATNPATVWTPIGSEYIMKISGTPGALLPTAVHEQEYPICWVLAAGERFPAHLTVRAQVVWGFEDADKLNDNTAYSVFDLSAQKTEAHIGLALDLSGSMMANFSGINTRLDIAKQKAQMFTFLVEDDQWLGVYGFATGNPLNSLFASNYTGTDNLPHAALLNHTSKISDSLTDIAGMEEINGNADRIAISNQINAQNAYGCTPIGQGLLRAKYGIDASTASATGAVSKAIVLFSDGFQNVPPFVNTDPPYTCGSNPVYTKISAEKTFKDNDMPIYSIYFGPTSGWSYFLMNQIKDQTGGSYVYGADTELEL
ncbi:MAG: VWA domain-containing protein, partial [bacterium]|nr:VWA domain-containing protein [bacterium]